MSVTQSCSRHAIVATRTCPRDRRVIEGCTSEGRRSVARTTV